MPLSQTGLSLTAIRTAFGGGTGAVSLNSYYRGGAKVPLVGSMNSSIPTSGAISIGNFNNAYYSQDLTGTLTIGTSNVSDGQKSPTNYVLTGFKDANVPGTALPYAKAWGTTGTLTNNSIATANGTFTIGGMGTTSYGSSTKYVFVSLYRTGSYPPNDDATFQQITVPGGGTVVRSSATLQQATNGSYYINTWYTTTGTLASTGTHTKRHYA